MDELDIDYEQCDQVPSLNSLSESLYNHHWEEESVHSIDDNCDFEKQLNQEKDTLSRKLWLSFQNAACSVAQLYKDRESGVSFWVPFQNAATDVTSLYKECIESTKRNVDLCLQLGMQRKNREVLAWAKKRKRFIRREDLLAFLRGDSAYHANHPSNYHHHHHHHHHYSHPHLRYTNSGSQRGRSAFSPNLDISTTAGNTNPSSLLCSISTSSAARTPPIVNHHGATGLVCRVPTPDSGEIVTTDEGDLKTFREALALSAAVRACSPLGNLNSSPNSRRASGCPKSVTGNSGDNASSLSELNDFISSEYSRHVESRKRVNPTTDVNMDSPTHKRSKLH
ncbi:HUWE1-associated protein modifying stress responses [Brevipalpus obovatus]|uniref:HUWE1-associated protein modifying stress responses n=1 Tax=Brevipalpus obovatus TaxID=246614 RepID=UPI003D9DD6B4